MKNTDILNNWQSIPENIRDALLSKIWCDNCKTFSAAGDADCRNANGGATLCGHCVRCGEEICRPMPIVKH